MESGKWKVESGKWKVGLYIKYKLQNTKHRIFNWKGSLTFMA
jgi:hypothetical protein